MNTMENQFKEYLISKGYKETTSSGNPSTVYDYVKKVNKICEYENMTWKELANNIGIILIEYDIGGTKEDLGKKSHNAVINALKRFAEFIAIMQ